MEIKSIAIDNFKGLKKAVFEPKSFSCLVGENNAGKSTVLQAMVYALNRPKNLPESMYYDKNKPVRFELRFEDVKTGDLNRLKLEHRTKLSSLVYGGELKLIAKYSSSEGLELLVSKLVPVQDKYKDENIVEAFKGIRSNSQARNIIEEQYPEFVEDLPGNATPAQVKAHLKSRVSSLDPDSFRYTDTKLPSGIPSSISALLPEPIYIPAVKNFEDDLKTTQSTSFGRLMGLLMEDLADDLEDISDTLIDLKKRLNRYTDESGIIHDERLEKVVQLEGTIEKFLSENFPNISIDLEIPPPEIKTILNTAKIYVDDGSRDLIDNKGDGVKRSLTFSLLRAYVDFLTQRSTTEEEDDEEILDKPLVFLFEEPELYLHPKGQRILFGTLAKISEVYQTVITTHNPLFFEPGVTAQFVRMTKEEMQPKPIGRLYPVDFELSEESLNTFRMAKHDHSEAAFFSNHIVLYEGESDEFFFRHIAKLLNPNWCFFQQNTALVEVGGKGNFNKFRKFFESFGLKVSILCDLDVITKDFRHLGASPKVMEIRNQFLIELDKRVEELGLSPVLTGKRVKKVVKNPRWVERYETAKRIICESANNGVVVSQDDVEQLQNLFVWENDEARYSALTTDKQVEPDLINLLDSLRSESIYVLSKGAIEEYYPEEITANCSKPERVLKVIEHIQSKHAAILLSEPLRADGATEFEEIFASLFDT